jgi:photosystem II stability/assembly factor-like uncharacterized protein
MKTKPALLVRPVVALLAGASIPASCASGSTTAVSVPSTAIAAPGLPIESVAMPEPGVIWVRFTDGFVDFSDNAGSTWADRTPPGWVSSDRQAGYPEPGSPPETLSSSSGWMARLLPGAVVSVAHSTDEGKNWQLAQVPRSYASQLFGSEPGPVGISAVGSSAWVSVGLPSGSAFAFADLFRSDDGGSTWSFETEIDGAAGPVEFVSPMVGFAAGIPAADGLMVTTDGGRTWSRAPLAAPAGMAAVQMSGLPEFTDPEYGAIYGDGEKAVGKEPLYPYMDVTSDGGVTWTAISIPYPQDVGFVWSVVRPGDWFLVGERQVLHTVDGGATWSRTVPDRVLSNPHQVDFASDSTGVALVSSYSCNRSPTATSQPACGIPDTVLYTDDGGHTWRVVTPPNP